MTPGLDRQELYDRVKQEDLEANGEAIIQVFKNEVKILGNRPERMFIGGFS